MPTKLVYDAALDALCDKIADNGIKLVICERAPTTYG